MEYLAFFIVFLVALTFSISLTCFLSCFYNLKKKKTSSPNYTPIKVTGYENAKIIGKEMKMLLNEKFERVEIKSFDNLTLRGNFYKFNNENSISKTPLFIFFHGLHSNMYCDFSGIYKTLKNNNINVLLVCQRAHGISDGRVSTFGIKEKYDVKSWVNFAIEKYGKNIPIILGGISMGASSIMMATELNLPKNVKMLSCDCGYSSPEEVIKIHIKSMKMPVWFFYPFLKLGAIVFGGFSVKVKPNEEILKNNKIPIIFFHGEKDDIVPINTCKSLYSNCGGVKQLVSFPYATHGLSYLFDKKKYEREYLSFMNLSISN